MIGEPENRFSFTRTAHLACGAQKQFARHHLVDRMQGDDLGTEREVIMRYARLLVVMCLSLVTLAGRGQETTAEEKAFFDKNVGKLVKLEPTPITGQTLEKVFAAKFYTVKMSMGGEEGVRTLVAARLGEDLKDVTMPEANTDMPTLKALVRAGFKLKADADGKAFEQALDLLYPVDVRYDEKRKAVRHSGTEWTFIRGAFIGNFKGLVVTADADGTITSIKYSREIK